MHCSPASVGRSALRRAVSDLQRMSVLRITYPTPHRLVHVGSPAVCALWRQPGPLLWLQHDAATGFGPSAGRMTRLDDKLLAVATELSYDSRLSVKVRAPYHAVSRFV